MKQGGVGILKKLCQTCLGKGVLDLKDGESVTFVSPEECDNAYYFVISKPIHAPPGRWRKIPIAHFSDDTVSPLARGGLDDQFLEKVMQRIQRLVKP